MARSQDSRNVRCRLTIAEYIEFHAYTRIKCVTEAEAIRNALRYASVISPFMPYQLEYSFAPPHVEATVKFDPDVIKIIDELERLTSTEFDRIVNAMIRRAWKLRTKDIPT